MTGYNWGPCELVYVAAACDRNRIETSPRGGVWAGWAVALPNPDVNLDALDREGTTFWNVLLYMLL